MKKLTFYRQINLGLAVHFCCFLLAVLFKIPYLQNIGWIFYGLLFLMHPVFPENVNPGKHGKLWLRIVSAVIIYIGITGRFGL